MSDGLDDSTVGPTPLNSLFFSKSLHNWDSRLSLRIHEVGQRIPRFVLRAFEYSGDGLFWIPITSALCWAPYFTLQPFIKNLLLGFMFDLALIGLVKALIRRPRPVYNKGMYLIMSVDHFSFPSGHSSRAFLIFTFVLMYAFEWKGAIFGGLRGGGAIDLPSDVGLIPTGYSEMCFYFILSLCGSWTVATASSRILLGRHFLFDVVAGSLLGILEALFVMWTLSPVQFFLDDQQRWLLEHLHNLKEAALKYA